LKVVQIIITSTIGMFAISGGMEGYMAKKMPWWERLLAVIGGLALIEPKLATDIIGMIIIAFIFTQQYIIKDKKQVGEVGLYEPNEG
jgi:TRAP-type uncharacterized transport system fused permease subunit